MDPVLDAAVNEFVAAETDPSLIERSANTMNSLYESGGQRATDPLVLVFTGAARARMAKATIWPWKQMKHAEAGMSLLDKSLQSLTPDHNLAPAGFTSVAKEVTFVAAAVFSELPSFFNRSTQANKLLDGLLNGLENDATPPDFKASVNVLAGRRALRAGKPDEAREFLRKAIAYGTPVESADANRVLKGMER